MAHPPKILFTGITGLLGKYFLKEKSLYPEIIGIADKDSQQGLGNFFKVDITDKELITRFIKEIKPSVIVHAASLGNVDYCEKNPDEANRVNILGTENVIEAATSIKSKLIFISSNAVFDGENPLYDEKSPLNPVDTYGKTKMEGEKLIKNSNLDFVILRLITMYGWNSHGGRKNPVTWVIDSLKKGENINVVDDIYNNHLWAGQAAKSIWAVIEKDIKGKVYNIAGADCISRFNLALKVAQRFNLNQSLIHPVKSSFFQNIAKRPKNTCFDTTKMEKELGIKALSVDEGLSLMKQEAAS